MFLASQVLLLLDAPWYTFGFFLVALWALLMLYYRGRDKPNDPRSRQHE